MRQVRVRVVIGLCGLVGVGGCALMDDQASPVPAPAVDVASLRCDAPPVCSDAAATVERYVSSTDLERRLVGAWWACDATSPYGRGIEVTPARELFVLGEPTATGACQRAAERAPATWSVLDISEQNPAGTYQLTVDWGDVGTSIMVPTFSLDARDLTDAFGGRRFVRL